MTITALVILLSGLVPLKEMILAIPGTESLPPNYPSRDALETFKDHFVAKEKRDEKKVTMVLETKGSILEINNLEKVKKVINDLEYRCACKFSRLTIFSDWNTRCETA